MCAESILLLSGIDHFYDGIVLARVQNGIKESFYLSRITWLQVSWTSCNYHISICVVVQLQYCIHRIKLSALYPLVASVITFSFFVLCCWQRSRGSKLCSYKTWKYLFCTLLLMVTRCKCSRFPINFLFYKGYNLHANIYKLVFSSSCGIFFLTRSKLYCCHK